MVNRYGSIPGGNVELLIKIGAIYNLIFAVYHCFFWKLFKWNTELGKLNFINQSIMHVMNLCLIFCFLFFSYISFFFTADMLGTALGKSMLACISIFWLLRAIEQAVFFKLKHWLSVVFLIIFTGGAVIYAIPLLSYFNH